MGVAHLDFCGHEGRDRVNDDDVITTRADQHVGNLEGLLTPVSGWETRRESNVITRAPRTGVEGVLSR